MTEDRNEGVASGEPMHGDDQTILMESGSIRSDGNCDECRVSRGMPAISIDGQEVGWVAAVVIDAEGASTAIVMARPQTTLEYYLLPLGLIRSVNDRQVLLRIGAEAARSLTRRNVGATR